MKVMLIVKLPTPQFDDDLDAEDSIINQDVEKMNIVDGLASVDMEQMMTECLNTWYDCGLEEGDLTILDAVELVAPADRRRNNQVAVRQNGGIQVVV